MALECCAGGRVTVGTAVMADDTVCDVTVVVPPLGTPDPDPDAVVVDRPSWETGSRAAAGARDWKGSAGKLGPRTCEGDAKRLGATPDGAVTAMTTTMADATSPALVKFTVFAPTRYFRRRPLMHPPIGRLPTRVSPPPSPCLYLGTGRCNRLPLHHGLPGELRTSHQDLPRHSWSGCPGRLPPAPDRRAAGEGRRGSGPGCSGQHGLGRGEAGHRDPEGRAADVVEARVVEEGDGGGVAAVLAADAHLEARP